MQDKVSHVYRLYLNFICTIGLITASSSTLAQTPQKPTPPQAPQTPPKKEEPKPERRHPILIGNAKFLSVGIPTSFNLGVGVGANIWRIASVEFDYQSGTQNLGFMSAKIGTLSQDLWGFQGRFYPMLGSFNLLGGYGFRQMKAELDIAGVPTNTDVTVTHRVAAAGFGNRFYSGAFFLGMDWVVVHWRISDASVSSQVFGQALDKDTQKSVDDIVRRLNNIPTVTLLNLHLGYGW